MKQRIVRTVFLLSFAIIAFVVTGQVSLVAAETIVAAQDVAVLPADNLGRKIYREGLLPSGESISGIMQSDVPLVGEQLSCSDCHGRSGHGSTEGSIIIPAITGTLLYEAKEIRRRELYTSKLIRPAYTDESLALAIRSGIDANGEALNIMMPRYALSNSDTGLLIDYIKSLSPSISPGVTDEEIHFATVITDDVAGQKRKAVLDVLTAFFESKNAATRQEPRRVDYGPFHKEWRNQAYRKWALHVWELVGPADGWGQQLQHYYKEQPVFALVSGIGERTWWPVHEFCEARSVPCILPNTVLPKISESDYYSLYFSKGITLEAEVLARHLRESGDGVGRIIQVYRADDRALTAAKALRSGLEGEQFPRVHDSVIPDGEQITAEFWRALVEVDEAYSLVLWIGDNDLSTLDAISTLDPGPERIYLASSMLDESLQMKRLPVGVLGRASLLYPYELPSDATGRLKHASRWFRQRQIEITDERLQSNVLFAGMLVSQALKHIGSNYYGDYFLERIEHQMDSMATLASYRNLSLARNQRFASKGCYIATLSEGVDGEIVLEGEWIVP